MAADQLLDVIIGATERIKADAFGPNLPRHRYRLVELK
jgi:hypothetical protein